MSSLGGGATEEKVLEDMRVYLQGLSNNVKVINDFLQESGEERTGQV